MHDTIAVKNLSDNFSIAVARKDFKNADYYHRQAVQLIEKSKNRSGLVSLIYKIDADLISIGNYRKAIEYLFELKKLSEKLEFHEQTSIIINSIGIIYWQQGNPNQALLLYSENLALIKRTGIKGDLAAAYNNIGLAYRQLNQTKKAVAFYTKSLQMCIANNDYRSQANAYNNLGTIYQLEGKYNKALYYHNKALEIRMNVADSIGISMSLGNMGFTNLELKNYENAYTNLFRAYSISKRLNDPEGVKETSEGLSRYYELMNNSDSAFKYYKEYISTRDTLMGEEVKKELLMKEMQYKYEQEEQKREVEVKAEKTKQQLYTFMALVILTVVLIFSFLLYKRFALTQKQKNVIENQKKLVEEKQTEITDSIQYAKRIQTTLLAHKEFLSKHLPEYFIFYRPKDIVSGDFYWATQVNNKHENKFYLAVCDSTGHGVPGAFMSLLNITFLNEAINEKGIYQPNEVFNHVRKRLIESISQDGGQEGMDAILIQFNQETLNINYAAANNPPIVIRNNEVMELHYDKLPVGQSESDNQFRNFAFQLQKDDMLYLFTDGYADQFGGPKAKKFMYHRFNELLVSISKLPMSKQQSELADAFEKWKGSLDQIDDVCVIGIRI